MSDTPTTRRTDEPPTQDGATLSGWPVTIIAEETAALQTALKLVQIALDALTRERDEARAERDTLLLDAREFVRWFAADYITPSKHPDHPWGAINDRLNAHADTLAALDAAMADKGSGR